MIMASFGWYGHASILAMLAGIIGSEKH